MKILLYYAFQLFQVEICRTAGQFPQERFADTFSDSSSDSAQSREEDEIQNSAVTVRVSIHGSAVALLL